MKFQQRKASVQAEIDKVKSFGIRQHRRNQSSNGRLSKKFYEIPSFIKMQTLKAQGQQAAGEQPNDDELTMRLHGDDEE